MSPRPITRTFSARAASVLLVLCAVAAFASAADGDPVRTLSLAAQETKREFVFTVPARGVYALILDGQVDAAAVLLDRMRGPIATARCFADPGSSAQGTTALLEEGDYKVVASKDTGAPATLRVIRFRELGAAEEGSGSRFLLNYGAYRGLRLADGQTLAYSMTVTEADPRLRFIAFGRSLGGSVLLRDGQWDTGAEAKGGTVELSPGKPVIYREYDERLEPGTYTVLLWGAAAQPWSGGGTEDGLFVASGARRLDDIGAYELTLGEAGIESFLVPPDVDFAQASVPGKEVVTLSWSSGSPRLRSRGQAITNDKGGSPWASLDLRDGEECWISVKGETGTKVTLRVMHRFPNRDLGMELDGIEDAPPGATATEAGRGMVRFIGAEEGANSVPLTALGVGVSGTRRSPTISVFGEALLPLSSSSPVRLDANLSDLVALLVDVAEDGRYVVLERDTKKVGGRWSFVNIDAELNGKDQDEEDTESGKTVDLKAGRYLVTISPDRPGILEAVIAKESLGTKLGGMGLWKQDPARGTDLSWYGVDLSSRKGTPSYAVLMGKLGSTPQGISARPYPVDLTTPASFVAQPGKEQTVPLYLPAPAYIRVQGTGNDVSVLLDGAQVRTDRAYPAGRHSLSLAARREVPRWIGLEAIPQRAESSSGSYLGFSEGKSTWAEFAIGETKRFVLEVSTPSLYSVSTTGRLAMGITLRGSLSGVIGQDQGSGPGRNSRVSAYLKSGRYLVEATALGASTGWGGVTIEKRAVGATRRIGDGGTARATIAAGEAAAIELAVDREARWTLNAVGLGRRFQYRMEDPDGFPVGPPVGSGIFSAALGPGTYRYLSLPDDVETRRVFTLSAAKEENTAANSGNTKEYPVELDRSYRRRWAGTGPDVAVLELPARVDVTLDIDDSMAYRVLDGSGAVIGAGLGGKSVALPLGPGISRILTTPIQEDQDHPYTLRLSCPDLMDGRTLQVRPGSVLPVTISRAGRWEFVTSGAAELEAALFAGAAGGFTFEASSSSIPDDWNCRLSAELDPGRYALKIAAPGDSSLTDPPDGAFARTSGSSSITLRFRDTVDAGTFVSDRGGYSAQASTGPEFLSFAFPCPATGPYRISASSADPVELALYADDSRVATGIDAIAVVLRGGTTYRLRCGRIGDAQGPIVARAEAVPFRRSDVADSKISVSAPAAAISDPSLASRYGPEGRVLVAPDTDSAFVPFGESPRPLDGAWILSADGGTLGDMVFPAATLDAAHGAGIFSLLPSGQRVFVEVGADEAALFIMDGRGYAVSATDSKPAQGGAAPGVDWEAMSLAPRASALGLPPGRRQLLIRDSLASDAGGRTIAARLQVLPVSATLPPPEAGTAADYAVEAGTALKIDIGASPKAEALRLSLEAGLSAFLVPSGAGARTTRTWTAGDASRTFPETRAGGSLYLLNPGPNRATAAVLLSAQAPGGGELSVAPGAPLELVRDSAGIVSIKVEPGEKDSRLVVAGTYGSLIFYDSATGAAGSGRALNTPAGPVTLFDPSPGILEVHLDAGWLAARISAIGPSGGEPEALLDASAGAIAKSLVGHVDGVAATPLAGSAAIPPSSSKVWTCDVRSDSSLLSASAGGAGYLAVFGPDGELLRAAASTDGQNVLVPAKRGLYRILVRPFGGLSRNGSASASTGNVTSIEASGPGRERLIVPGERHVYRFSLKTASKVGVGVEGEKDSLAAALYDADLRPVDSGPLMLGDLEAGDYYLVVESGGGTVRYAPVFYGLEGSRTGVPDEVIATFTNSGE